ncbi:prepilin peptidase [Streptomyces orinoci]|uniref:A24 family peptidase n=1 Tax=Streptomyces orinoci TaxID=67339 RepID=A0ABV3JSF7_STRON|nr:A24 family peptidase [Streptomyces orinoci]
MTWLLAVLAGFYGAVAGWLLPRVRYRLAVEEGQFGLGGVGGGAAVTGALCAGLALATGARPELAVWLLAAPVTVLLAEVDRSVRRLPDLLTLPLALAVTGLLGVVALIPGAAGSWPGALLGAAALGGWYLLLFLIHPRGMGFGDVKLALGLGGALGWYGWAWLIFGGFAGLLAGAAFGLWLLLVRRAGRGTTLAFGPFMIAGAWSGVLLGAWSMRG